ncbi:MAG: 3-methyl-2-oxobutanoate hydroxymethyltransferase [Planctomycetota bacterium]
MSSHPEAKKKRLTVPGVRRRKGKGLTMVTAYTYSQARLVDRAGVDLILVGDSAANVILGHDSTVPVTVDQMLIFAAAARRGTERALVIGDLPFLSYTVSVPSAIRNAGRFLKEANVDAVKLEGGVEVQETVAAIVRAGIPVVGHIGLTPQTVGQLGGYKVQGKSALAARHLVDAAIALEDAGAFALVLECVPSDVTKEITDRLEIPTIGIGAGPHCDGQVLVFHDLLGLGSGRFQPRFVKRYAELGDLAVEALQRYVQEVQEGSFPGPEHGFAMSRGEGERLPGALSKPRRGAVGDGLVAGVDDD